VNHVAQFGFQNRWVRGSILNVGSNCDPGRLRYQGAVNVDLHRISPATGVPNVVNVLADARTLPFKSAFDTVVLGDILEHFDDQDILFALREARSSLKTLGRIVITCPDDHRSLAEQAKLGIEAEYSKGVPSLHPRPMPIMLLETLIRLSGLKVKWVERIRYSHFDGWGVVATC
jgi:SAM-dependent methyltransferase